ncbi:MAG: siphovirus ReqiPepy6 Gp37-like family protein [Eubacterium aggregans]|uniref:siphovirus ReqiPepy6 Gp37-like family protein n=1 Tax=Eubacterium aggregans TaxID=81409 RepID=UPI002B211CE6|nr:siphovirus ReqiPepy6 Gp37-like family protein [Eubacterium aggregans]MEA5073099.1 siphovirus ReqiPepy6 Gp37-like family protein [Eubacterium aggregans]
MMLTIFNEEMQIIGMIGQFKSLTRTKRFYAPGDIKLYVQATKKNSDLLKSKKRIHVEGTNEIYIIETARMEKQEKGLEYIQVNGRSAECLIERRICWERIKETKITYEDLMRKIVNDNCVNPADSKRKIPGLYMGERKGYSEILDIQKSFGNALNAIMENAEEGELGFRCRFDPKTRMLYFEVLKGIDRTDSQSTNKKAVFSRDLMNVVEQNYTDTIRDYANCALIGGQGQDDERIMTEIGTELSGLQRFEIFVDANDISKKKDDNTEMSDADYKKLLKQRGRTKLSEKKRVKTLDGTYRINGKVYDVDCGDVVTVYDEKWSVYMDTQITEIATTCEKGAPIKKSITFGTKAAQPLDELEKLKKGR